MSARKDIIFMFRHILSFYPTKTIYAWVLFFVCFVECDTLSVCLSACLRVCYVSQSAIVSCNLNTNEKKVIPLYKRFFYLFVFIFTC